MPDARRCSPLKPHYEVRTSSCPPLAMLPFAIVFNPVAPLLHHVLPCVGPSLRVGHSRDTVVVHELLPRCTRSLAAAASLLLRLPCSCSCFADAAALLQHLLHCCTRFVAGGSLLLLVLLWCSCDNAVVVVLLLTPSPAKWWHQVDATTALLQHRFCAAVEVSLPLLVQLLISCCSRLCSTEATQSVPSLLLLHGCCCWCLAAGAAVLLRCSTHGTRALLLPLLCYYCSRHQVLQPPSVNAPCLRAHQQKACIVAISSKRSLCPHQRRLSVEIGLKHEVHAMHPPHSHKTTERCDVQGDYKRTDPTTMVDPPSIRPRALPPIRNRGLWVSLLLPGPSDVASSQLQGQRMATPTRNPDLKSRLATCRSPPLLTL